MHSMPWSEDFDENSDQIKSVVAWIRLPGMPVHLYYKKVFRKIGKIVGKIVKIDHQTAAQTRGKFARLAVVLDLTKTVCARFTIRGKKQPVEYEYLPNICFHCGHYGHATISCPDRTSKGEVPDGSGIGGGGAVDDRGKGGAASPHSNQEIRVEDSNGHNKGTMEEESIYGPWLLAKPTGRPSFWRNKEVEEGNKSAPLNLEVRDATRFQVGKDDLRGNTKVGAREARKKGKTRKEDESRVVGDVWNGKEKEISTPFARIGSQGKETGNSTITVGEEHF
ncbi:OLC1v1016052C1 [Oldenlandia corymbosa var. corymbosa]|uniref:OLC1v1016052C1 n=1 Tax=Oldenlandia corymbosa var. corymbosa TaxID=529605 RepID=A0AAV1E575_OLDCO|nr:OLC1v1016052C1 [Oldenlandia corymbosa var. corymbosa]